MKKRHTLFLAVAFLLPLAAAAADGGAERPWARFARAYNGASALREFSETLNRLNETAKQVEGYERGLVVSAGDDKKVLLDSLKADYAQLRRLLPEVDKELGAEQRAAEGLK